MAATELAKKSLYLNRDIDYIKNTIITEWDIKSAGFSVIKHHKLLDDEMIEELENMPKFERNVKIGYFQKYNPAVSSLIVNTLKDVREEFVLRNDIEEEDILSIKKDAIFLIKRNPEVTTIQDDFLFRSKSIYTSYINLNNKEFYYSNINKEFIWKGLSNDDREACYRKPISLENDVILSDIKRFLNLSEKQPPELLFSMLSQYREQYLTKRLPIQTYRNLNTGAFDIVVSGKKLQAEDIDESMLDMLDISQNYINYILPMIQLML